jgi:hypothetical protein
MEQPKHIWPLSRLLRVVEDPNKESGFEGKEEKCDAGTFFGGAVFPLKTPVFLFDFIGAFLDLGMPTFPSLMTELGLNFSPLSALSGVVSIDRFG